MEIKTELGRRWEKRRKETFKNCPVIYKIDN